MACLFLKHLLNFLCSPSFVYFISFNETTVPGSAAIIFMFFPFPSTSYGMTTRRRVLAMRKALKISKTSHTFLINFSSADYLATFVHICFLTISTATVLCTDFCSLHGKKKILCMSIFIRVHHWSNDPVIHWCRQFNAPTATWLGIPESLHGSSEMGQWILQDFIVL